MSLSSLSMWLLLFCIQNNTQSVSFSCQNINKLTSTNEPSIYVCLCIMSFVVVCFFACTHLKWKHFVEWFQNWEIIFLFIQRIWYGIYTFSIYMIRSLIKFKWFSFIQIKNKIIWYDLFWFVLRGSHYSGIPIYGVNKVHIKENSLTLLISVNSKWKWKNLSHI